MIISLDAETLAALTAANLDEIKRLDAEVQAAAVAHYNASYAYAHDKSKANLKAYTRALVALNRIRTANTRAASRIANAA